MSGIEINKLANEINSAYRAINPLVETATKIQEEMNENEVVKNALSSIFQDLLNHINDLMLKIKNLIKVYNDLKVN